MLFNKKFEKIEKYTTDWAMRKSVFYFCCFLQGMMSEKIKDKKFKKKKNSRR